jgi:nucleoside-diphosphate-sugar epimerase
VLRTWAAVDRAAADLGYHPKVAIEEGLRRFVAWMRAQP